MSSSDMGASVQGGSGASEGPIRRERRVPLVREVEYTPFPRSSLSRGERAGFTRDLSPSGMCLRVTSPERIGALLRIVVRDVDGRPTLDSVGRITWCEPIVEGGWWMGLSLVGRSLRRPQRVRRPRRSAFAA